MKQFVTILILVFALGCKKQDDVKKVESEQQPIEKDIKQRVTEDEIDTIDYLDYGLSRDTKTAISGWESYTQMDDLVTSVKSGDLSFFHGDDETMKVLISDLKKNIPERVDNQSTKARLTAMETKFHELKSAVRIENTPKQELLAALKEFLEAFSNLNFQMNKKLEKESQDRNKYDL